MNIHKKSYFPWMLGASALFVALCAAFFSVYGISTLFAGAFISAVVMASSLEIGKLVGVTFLYRYWNKTKGYLKAYLTIAAIVLMVITSLGIFGYLSAAYQKSSIEFAVTQEKIKTTEDRKVYYQDKITAAKKRVDDLTKLRVSQENRMSEVLTNEFLSRNPLSLKQLQQQTVDLITDTDKNIKDENAKIQTSIDDVQKIDDQVNQLKLGVAEKKDVQTFKFVADALGMSLDNVARWFIVMVIFVFDPLAIGLILAYNVAVYRTEDESVYDVPEPQIAPQEPSPAEKMASLLHDSEPQKTDVPEKKLVKIELPKVNTSEEPTVKPEHHQPKEGDKSWMSDFFRSYFKK